MGADLDREEPDVVALAGQSGTTPEFVCVADPGGAGWIGQRGTSLAAPAVTSMIALLKEYCDPILGYPLDQRMIRSLFRTMAFAGDPEGPAYSTPRPSADFKDGAGLLNAADVYNMCEGSLGGFGTETIDLSGGTPLPTGDTPYLPGFDPDGETQSFEPPGAEIQDFSNVPGVTSLASVTLLELDDLKEGDRIRFTWAWDACATANTGDAPVSVSVDFDVFFYNAEAGYVWASQSFDDNNEGFDYTIPEGQDGDYVVYLAWPVGALSCTGTDEILGSWTWMPL